MNPFGLPFDHPGFPERAIITLETWQSFAWAGAGHGVYTAAFAGMFPMAIEGVGHYLTVVILGIGAWLSFSPATRRDYRLHYLHEPPLPRLFLLQLLHLAGFILARAFLHPHASKFAAPLYLLSSSPPPLLANVYRVVAVYIIWKMVPEATIVSSRGFTLPKVTARMAGVFVEAYHEMHKEMMAATAISPQPSSPSHTQSQYQYTSISTPRTVRLLRIESKERNAACSFVTVLLDEAPAYWALSYLWGSEEKPKLLKITNQLGQTDGCIAITKNCASAVQALMPMGARYLWIDVICINQSDTIEKEFQIPLMGEIYSKAALVVGHLHTEHLFRVSLLIHRMVQALANGKQFDMSHGATYPIFRALTEIFCNPYFQRAWVVQEIVLAKSIILVYGSDCIHLDHLMEIVRGQSSGKIVPGGSFIMGRIDRTQLWMDEWKSLLAGISPFGDQMTVTDRLRQFMRLEALKRPTIAEMVDQNVSLGVKNPRDRIYALLSLASDPTTPELQPNYNIDVSNKDIFTRVSWHYLQDGRHLNLFLGAGLAIRESHSTKDIDETRGLPSWAYDFGIGRGREVRLGNWAADVERHREAGLTCYFAPDKEQLSARGMIIGRVAVVAPWDDVADKWSDQRVRELQQSGLPEFVTTFMDRTLEFTQQHVPEHYPSGITQDEAYWRTLLMDRFLDETPAPPEAQPILRLLYEMAPQILTDTQPMKHMPDAIKAISPDHRYRALKAIADTVIETWLPYTFVVLESGWIGWAPPGVQPGDTFCLFDGCIVPFLLRPVLGSDKFRLWGDGYVHGYLPGQQPGGDGRTKQWLKLV
jgi:Heterokaryon incompatibility protein (HET)